MYNHVDEIWSINLADFSDSKTLNNRGYRYNLEVTDNFSKLIWCIPLENKHDETIEKKFQSF